MDLIDRQDAIDALQKEINKGIPPFDDVMGSIRCGVRLARNIIEDLPSAEPVIRCKDCKHMIINEKHEAKPMICCFTKMCGTTEPDWFCADGERREDETD